MACVFSEHGEPLQPAVLTLEEIIVRFGREKRNGKRVVFTNGCFDLLHPGHIHSLETARALGDVLIVGINSDESVRALKGPGPAGDPSGRARGDSGESGMCGCAF